MFQVCKLRRDLGEDVAGSLEEPFVEDDAGVIGIERQIANLGLDQVLEEVGAE